MEKFKTLIIGCGNIGAMYDFENENIQSHAKAYFLNGNFEVSIFDQNKELALKVSERYNFDLIEELTEQILKEYNCISICSPTNTHFGYLKTCFELNIPLVICEKPLDLNLTNLKQLIDLYRKSSTKVLVNYTRRFQNAFELLRDQTRYILKNESLRSIHINYHRGFLNNCSHAFDTIEYLLDKPIELENIQVNNSVFDVFKDDPTISMYSSFDNSTLTLNGLTEINYSIFEIYLFFDFCIVKILDSGNYIEIQNKHKDKNVEPILIIDGLVNYMEPIIENAHSILIGNQLTDNFERSILLTEKMIKYLNNNQLQ